MTLQTLPPTATTADIQSAMAADGAVIVRDLAPVALQTQLRDELVPFIDSTPQGADDFTGRNTQRTGALVARTPAARDFVLNQTVIDAASAFLAPYTDRIVLHLTQAIKINPGQGAQPLHRDRLAWGGWIPREIEPQFNTIWALTDFTLANGATRVVPGSHRWESDARADPEQIDRAEMPAGSVLLYTGSVLHSGGKNESSEARLGLNITYCLGWLRQEENQYLSCPPHIAATLSPQMQDLLGYTQGNYALGYYSDPEFDPAAGVSAKTDILPPEHALGHKARSVFAANIAEGRD